MRRVWGRRDRRVGGKLSRKEKGENGLQRCYRKSSDMDYMNGRARASTPVPASSAPTLAHVPPFPYSHVSIIIHTFLLDLSSHLPRTLISRPRMPIAMYNRNSPLPLLSLDPRSAFPGS
jgi:hypothetical protein